MSYTTTLHYVPKASWRSLSGSAQNRPVFESFRDDRLASVRVATGKGAAVEETVRKLVLTLPHARARSPVRHLQQAMELRGASSRIVLTHLTQTRV